MSDSGISILDLKRRNRMQILRVIRENGPISRVDISEALQITRAAVTMITNEMIAQNILEEVGEMRTDSPDTRKGRRKVLLDINPTFRFAFGVYIDEESVSVGMTTLTMATMEKRTFPIDDSTTMEEILSMIGEAVPMMLKNSCLKSEHIIGIGIGVMPQMWEKMGVRNAQRSSPEFSHLEEAAEKMLGIPAFAGSAISLFAVADNHYQEHLGIPLNEVLLYAAEDAYHMAVLHQNELIDEYRRETDIADSLCVNPGGRRCEGYCSGSVKAELTASAIGEKAAAVYDEKKTPVLYRLTNGNGQRISLVQILTAWNEGDSALQPLVTELLNQFSMLLINLEQMFFAHKISLYKFEFTQQHLELLRSHIAALAGEEAARKIVLCRIEPRYHFACGSAYAIQRGFFYSGGLALDSDEEEAESCE